MTPLKAIRAHCIECMCGQVKEVKLCVMERCPLHPFRMASNPFRAKREMTEEQKTKMAENLKRAREQKTTGKI